MGPGKVFRSSRMWHCVKI